MTLTEGWKKPELNDVTRPSDGAGGSPTNEAPGPAGKFFGRRLHLIELLRLRSTRKMRYVQGLLTGETYCERFIRVVNCTPVSCGVERDEREVSHDEKPEELVVILRLWQ